MQDINYDNDMPVTAKHSEEQDNVVSVLQWFGTFLLMFIPGVNIVLLFIWAFSNKINKNKKNWAIATLYIFAIVTVLLVILYAMLVSMFNRMFGD